MTTAVEEVIDRSSYINALINKPWARDGRHCWRLVREVKRDLFGELLPPIVGLAPIVGPAGAAARRRIFQKHAHMIEQVSQPFDGAIAVMCAPLADIREAEHTGVYLSDRGGGVLHCSAPHGVVFDDPLELRMLRRWRVAFFQVVQS